MKTERLLETALILLNRRTVTAGELAERFGVSVRTIYRDLDALSAAGVPVYTTQGSHGGISLMEGYTLNRVLFSPREREALSAALKSLNSVQYPELGAIIDKLGAVINSAEDWIEVDFSAWGESDSEKGRFADIKQAVMEKRLIHFEYINAEGEKSARTAEPLKLLFKDNAWYLSAYCRKRKESRTFRISRMKKVELLAETFMRRAEKKAKEQRQEKKIFFELKFSQKAVSRIYDIFDDSLITKENDGAYTLKTEISESEWLYGFILSLGESAEVKSPEHFRKEIARRLKASLDIYSDDF